ncbi:MAG TPA: molybdopterin converting factor subunit 1 [Opitutaceae bacterium]|jgi:molybdopterin converting factor subunit 1
MSTVRVRYFAALREERGVPEESMATVAADAGALYDELRSRHGLTLPRDRVRVAINDEFAPWTSLLREGDCVAFLPPVAGG